MTTKQNYNMGWSELDYMPAPPPGALGFPSSDSDLDVMAGFKKPPPGYGQVPYWWWTGDPLDKDRLLWQIEELHRKGVSGMQVNYAHEDTEGWPTYVVEPEIFTDQWWDVWKFVTGECSKRNMGIGLSCYTLDWPNGKSLVSRTIYSDPEIQGREIQIADRVKAKAGMQISKQLPPQLIGVHAYRMKDQILEPGGIDLSAFIKDGQLKWTPSEGRWEVWFFTTDRKAGTLNPMHPVAGKRVIEKFFQQFQDHAPNKSAAGLNYFFHDELKFGVGDHIWVDDFAEVFRKSKGYDVFEVLPALFEDIGPITPKARLDFMDVKVQLAEDRYFRPIFEWHWSRGKIYGCDQWSRGKDPLEYGDYFRSVRWYTAPGHDTPGGNADLIKGKVSSSIAHLYKRPRVWLEGYHSLGWGAAPERLMQATCENYIYGCSLLNLHGLYYSTHGSYWEWAPPSYHFRMPYWEHMDVFMRYFERLSYLLSQGVHCCDVAVMYPVAPLQAQMGGDEATNTAFETGQRLMGDGIDFDFMDFQSLDRAEIRDRKLHVSGEKYSVLVLPAMKALRWSTILKAREFYRAGGMVIAVGALPEASDRAGRDDAELDAVVREIFGVSARQVKAAAELSTQRNAAGGIGIAAVNSSDAFSDFSNITRLIPRDVHSAQPVKALHRKIGSRDVYMVMGAAKGSECFFRAHGSVELWDPWTAQTSPADIVSTTAEGTNVRMPLEDYEAQIIVFDSQKTPVSVETTTVDKVAISPEPVLLDGPWEFELKPTLDNQWGDFRLPVTNRMIGAEARIFRYAPEREPNPGWQKPEYDDSAWARLTYGFGQKFWKLGPLPDDIDNAELELRLASMKQVTPSVPIEIEREKCSWTPYAFSWRWGVEGDPGHQGFHGLKEKITDDFICLGKAESKFVYHHVTVYVREPAGGRYYLWTSVVSPEELEAKIITGGLAPVAVYINGVQSDGLDKTVALKSGSNPLLLCYDKPGRGHFVLERVGSAGANLRTPLSMQWYDRPGVLPFDAYPSVSKPAGWYRFTAPPGLRRMTLVAHGNVKAWVDGLPLQVERIQVRDDGAVRYELNPGKSISAMAGVALRIEQERSFYGGAALPDPIRFDCGAGLMDAGDWSKDSALECYSGGAWYRKTVVLSAEQTKGRVLLNLGKVVATAEVRVNGKRAGIRVAPPWTVDVSEFVKPGENRIEILVYNTLANHYLTIPTRYRGSLQAGLLGPVRMEFK